MEANPEDVNKWYLRRTLAAYWILGLCNNYGYVVMLTAAHDILENLHEDRYAVTSVLTTPAPEVRKCNYISTGAILLADIVPALFIKLISPFAPFYIHFRVALCISLSVISFLLVAFAKCEALAIIGVVFTSLSSGFGEVSLLRYSSYYNRNVVSTWSSGTGGAGILGSISYTGLVNLGLRTALLIMLVIPVAMIFTFWLLLPPPKLGIISPNQSFTNKEVARRSFVRKIKLIPHLLKFMTPLILVYFFQYFINQGLFELLQFDNIFLTTNQRYHWLQVDYQLGVFIGRSSVNLIYIKKIWLLSLLQFINVAVCTTDSVFYYIPTIWIILCIVFWEGLIGGAAYVNTFYKISNEVPEENRPFSMSATSISDAIGITLAGIFAIPIHNAICSLPKPERLSF